MIAEIAAAPPPSLDEPIEVVRVDGTYFVNDGHKRVSLAKRDGREFIDARVSHTESAYEVTPELDEEAILRTAREGEFRRHSGAGEALPDVRFVVTEMNGYGELFAAVRQHAFEMAERAGRIQPWSVVARDWFATDYRPTVVDARARIGELIDSLTDADIYLVIHRQRLAWWGTECDAVDCAAQELLVRRHLEAARRSTIRSVLGRAARSRRAGAGPPCFRSAASEPTGARAGQQRDDDSRRRLKAPLCRSVQANCRLAARR